MSKRGGDVSPGSEPHLHAEGPGSVALAVTSVSHRFQGRGGRDVLATDDVTFSVPQGQFLAVIGPSGCGKTTILNMLAGLLPTSSGVVAVRGERVTAPNREIGYMSARDGLLPWRTARENVELGLEIRGMAKNQRRRKADELLALVGLEGFEDSHRAQLSQGMRQRVAIARTLAIEPSILLMDEPFAALDAQTKTTLQQHFAQLWEQDRKTVMLVTHDIEEAVALADRVLVFSPRPGRIVADIEIDIPRPRAINDVRFTERFRDLTHELWKSLHGSTEGAA